MYIYIVCLFSKKKIKQQFDSLKPRRNKHCPVFLSQISPSLNSARMHVVCDASTNRHNKSLYSHRKIDNFAMHKKKWLALHVPAIKPLLNHSVIVWAPAMLLSKLHDLRRYDSVGRFESVPCRLK